MQKNGTTLPDTMHELLVYKIDHKKFDVNYTNYLSLPSTRSERDEIGLKTLPHLPGLSLFLKDFLVIETNVCSTKLTQNVDLLGFLNWHSDTTRLDVSLCNLMNLGGEEIVKFLQDILDTLFQILIENNNNAMIDHLVFDCLLHIIHLVVQNAKYQNFQAVLDLYLKENFSATLVYTKLISILSRHIAEGSTCNLAGKSKKGSPYSLKDTLLNSMKCIKYLMKIIIQSRHLFANLDNGAGEADFRNQIRELLFGIGKLISTASTQSTEILIVQGACLKYLPGIFPELLQVFDPLTLSKIIIEIIESPAAVQRLSRQRMMTLSALVDSQLFVIPESRRVLLPFILNSVRQFLDTNRLEEELCTSVLSDIMSFLWKTPTVEDIQDVTLIVLRTVVQNIFGRDCAKEQLGHLVAIMLSIFRHMSSRHYEVYISHLATNSDKSNFLTEILLVFKDLIERPVYPNDWLVMIRLQNEIMFKALKFFSDTVVEHFTRPFEYTAWSNWFHCMCVFLTQPSLQLELFSLEKRTKLLRDTPHSDMRIDAAQEIKRMWDILGENRSFFIPNQVGMFLQASLIPETEVRDILIPIFFDMMVCEFHSSPDQARNFIKGDFSEFENEMIVKLDALIEGGLGDSSYQSHFERILSPLCEKHSTLRDPGGGFVKSAAQQIDALLEYRSLVQDTNPDIRVRCTVRLLDFYAKTPRKELYLRYVHKLVALHLATEDYTEAAFTLELHAKLLSWNNEPIHPSYKLDRFPDLNTQRELKEALYEEAIVYFNKGKMWESALTLCKELFQVYDTEVFDYRKVELTLTKMPNLYEKIREKNRQELEYFRVGYYGRGFPTFLQNQVFIYRGKEYERLVDFTTRILNFYPHAELIKKLTPPDENITESCGQYFQINKVEPIMCTDIERKFSDKPICSEKIVAYFRWNGVQRFQYSCRVECPELNIPGLNRRSSSSEGSTMNRLSIISSGSQSGNEFATQWYQRHILSIKSPLPGIVRWFPVKSTKTVYISPINRAIETMDQANRNLKDLIMQVKNSKNEPNLKGGPFSTLLMTLKGIIAAEVNGGISNYETAFLHPSYLISNPDDAMFVSKLKDLIASQIPLLEVGLTLHAQRMESDMRPLHEHLESTFLAMKHSVEAKYGRKTCDISVDKLFLPPPPVYNAPATPTQDRGWSSLGFGTLNRPSKKKKNRERNKTLDTNSPSSSQWYDVARSANRNKTHSVITLSQELTPTRPLRSEVKRVNRLSQECVSLYSMDSEDADDCVTPTAATPPVIPEKRKENGELFSRENYDISISENVEQLIDGNEPIVDGHLHGHAEQSSAGNEDRLTVGKLDELLEKRCSRGNESLNSNSTVYSNSTVGSHSTLNPDSTNSSGNRSSTISSENQLSNTTSSENPLSSTTSSENPLSSTTSIEKPLSNSTSSETSLYNKTSSENQLSNKTSSENQLLNNTSSQNLLFGNNTSSENPMLNNTASETPLLNNTSSKTPLSSNTSSDNNSSSTISRESHIFRETPPSTSSTNENLALSAIARISIGHGTDSIDHGTDTIDHRPDTIAHGSDTITDHGTDSMIEPPKPKIPLKKKESGTNLLGIPGNEPADHHEPNGKDGFSTHNYDPVRIYPTVMYPGSPRITIQPSKPPPPDPGHPDYSSPGQDDDRAPTPPPVPPKSPKKGRSKSVPFGPSPDQQLEDYKSPPQPQPVRHAPSSKPVPQTPPESPLPVRWTQPVSDGLLHESPVPLRWPKVPPTATESPTPPARGIPPVRERRSSPGYVSSAQELLTSSVHPNYESVFPIKSCQTPPVHSNYDSVSPIHCRTPPVYSNYDSVSPINPRDPIGPWKTPYDIKQPEDLNRDHEYRGLNASLIAPPKPPLGKRQPLPSPAEEAVEEERNPIKYTHQEQVHRSTSLPLEAHHQDQTVAPTSECGIHAPPVYSNYNTIPLPLRIPQDTHQGPILPLKHRDVKHTPDRDVKQTPNQMYIKPEDLQIRLKSTPPPIPPHVFRRYSSSPNIEVRSSRGGGEDERPPTPPPKQPHIKSPLAMSVNRRQSPPDPPHP
uniref:Dedicator of cytokinesis protein 1 n=1 Tax=Cacopsylla melanoneura TaxID=428564 RepID=A0A8D8XE50_9HEMI